MILPSARDLTEVSRPRQFTLRLGEIIDGLDIRQRPPPFDNLVFCRLCTVSDAYV